MDVKKILICLSLAIGFFSTNGYSKEESKTPLADGKICILAIGNSFSQDAVEQYLYELFEAAGIEVVIGNMYIGGCRLDTHWANAESGNGSYAYRKIVDGIKTERSNMDLPSAISDENWDIITLQQASGSSGQYSTYVPYLQNLIDWLSERSEAEIWFHQTWAYAQNSDHSEFSKYDKDQLTMYNAIIQCAQNAMRDHSDLKGIIPSGTAVQNARTSFLGDTFNRDGYHLETTYGRYTAACTWFEAVSGINVVGNSYAPPSIDNQLKAVAQNASHLAVEKPYEVTEMIDFKKPQIQDGPLTDSIKIDFGSNSSDASWNSVTLPDGSDIILKDSNGIYTAAILTIDPAFDSTFSGVGSEPDDEIISGGISWPKKTWADSFVVVGTPGSGDSREACVSITGLEPSQSFSVTILSTRYNGTYTARQANFRLEGSTVYEGTINCGIRLGTGAGQFASWEEVPFEDYTLTFNQVRPNEDGSLQIFVKGIDVGSTVVEGYLSAVCLTPVFEDNTSSMQIEKEENNIMYNMLGQKIDKTYRGIVIRNGKKYISL